MQIVRTYGPWLLRLLGPLLLLLFLLNSDIEQMMVILRQAHVQPIVVSLMLIFPFLIIKGWRWRRILHDLHITLPLRTATGLYAVGVYLGSVTPGQAGDLVKAWYLRQRGESLAPALLSVVLDRLFDVIVMATLATVGIFALGKLLPSRQLQTVLVVGLGVGLTLFTVLLVARRPRQWVLVQLLPRIVPAQFHVALTKWNSQLNALALHPHLIVPVFVASLLSAAFTFYRLWLLFLAVDIVVPFYIIVGATALIAILQVLPISVAGIGVRDAVLLAVIMPYGYSQEHVLSVSALFLFLTFQQIIIGFIGTFWYPIVKDTLHVSPEQLSRLTSDDSSDIPHLS